MKHLKPRQVRHCRQAARKHGAYAADKYSIRAYLRLVDLVLMRLEISVSVDASKGVTT